MISHEWSLPIINEPTNSWRGPYIFFPDNIPHSIVSQPGLYKMLIRSGHYLFKSFSGFSVSLKSSIFTMASQALHDLASAYPSGHTLPHSQHACYARIFSSNALLFSIDLTHSLLRLITPVAQANGQLQLTNSHSSFKCWFKQFPQ